MYNVYIIYIYIYIYIYIIVYIHADAAQNASESNETLIRNHQNLMQSEGNQTLTDFHWTLNSQIKQNATTLGKADFSAPRKSELASRNAGFDQNVQLYTMGSQIITMPLQLLQNATQQSDHHTQQCQLQKLSQSHQAIAHQHMSTKCQKQQPDVDRDLAAQSDQIQDATKGCVPQIRQQWHGQTITEQIRLSQLQKHQTIHQNPSQVQKIQWESHQSLSENRCYQSESNENPTKAYQKTEVLNQNPMTIHQKLHQD